ncbi:hypothetical protein [Nocardia wallacei]|uniref:hypothetical protein n=1 Tax=Nocardia wallacei TaxID=480035 RepID=UPI0024572B22|nr:hypothetical protein [Nocardia wallacei]
MTTAGNYEAMLAQLREYLPDLAAEIDQELRRGRVATKQQLIQEAQYSERASRLADSELPAIGTNDVAVLPYSEEESLELIREAMITLAETMYATRQTLLAATIEYEMAPEILFGNPEIEEVTSLELRSEAARAEDAVQEIRNLLQADDRS